MPAPETGDAASPRPRMRALHFSTWDTKGGAARAAYHLLAGLRAVGCHVEMLVREKLSTDAAVQDIGAADRSFQQRLREVSLIDRKLLAPHRTPISNTLFTLPVPGLDLSSHPAVKSADLLHLHWVTGLLSPRDIGRLQATGRPLVWTLHDERAFTGGCHFTAGCRGFETECHPCPQLDLAQPSVARQALADTLANINAKRLTLVCPSEWLAAQVRHSAAFKHSRVEVIPYGTDTQLFRPRHSEARTFLGLPAQQTWFLAGAENPGELRKGFALLAQAWELCRRSAPGDAHLAVFGADAPPPGISLPARWLGRLDPESLAAWYAAADAFLLPSTEDNLPNTLLESLCSGTPAIAFRIGGIPDVIEAGRTGLMAEVVGPGPLAGEMTRFLQNAELRRQLRANLLAGNGLRFGLVEQARRTVALYEDLLRQPACPATESKPGADLFDDTFSALLITAKKEQTQARWRRWTRWLGKGGSG